MNGCWFLVVGKLFLGHSDNLSKSLQVKTLTAVERLTFEILQSIRSEEMFDLFWEKVTKMWGLIHQFFHVKVKGLEI